ncbi:MAG: hypothetical protein R3C15_14995 [Thermoleophilia bacterium]
MRSRSSRWRLRAALAVLALGALALAAPALGALSASPQATWVTDGTVDAIAVAPDGTQYLGGSFSLVGPRTGGFAVADTATGAVNVGLPDVRGTVVAIASDGAGGWFLGGAFSSVGGVARSNLAHVRADGVVDPAFAPNPDGAVRALALVGGTL